MIHLYKGVVKGAFVDRPNRFVVHMKINGYIVYCHMPNPGRMRELLFPGVPLYAVKTKNPASKTQYRIIGVERDGEVILLDTIYNNDVAEWLVNHHKIPGWESYEVMRREVTMGDSRFDLLLGNKKTGEAFPVEVKSCTLFGKHGAMFPDAVTARGKKHILHLGRMGQAGSHAGLLVLVHWDKARWFLPDYDTDPEFAKAFAESFPYIDAKIAAIHWTDSFSIPEKVRLLPTSMDVLKNEMGNRGDYMLVLSLSEETKISVGKLGEINFPKGYYVYVGSAKINLDQRVARQQRLRKKMHWHIDYLRQRCDYVGAVKIRTTEDLEHKLAHAVSRICDWSIPHFGCTDCECQSHLFGFSQNPMHLKAFTAIEEDFEINRLDHYFTK